MLNRILQIGIYATTVSFDKLVMIDIEVHCCLNLKGNQGFYQPSG